MGALNLYQLLRAENATEVASLLWQVAARWSRWILERRGGLCARGSEVVVASSRSRTGAIASALVPIVRLRDSVPY